jgi:hypothetical protein
MVLCSDLGSAWCAGRVAVVLVSMPADSKSIRMMLPGPTTVCVRADVGCLMVWGKTQSIQNKINEAIPAAIACAVCVEAGCVECAAAFLEEVRTPTISEAPDDAAS